MRRNFALVGALAAISAAAVPARAGDALRVDAVTTGNYSELIQSIPIEPNPGTWWRAMELKPSAMPDFDAGDRLRISAELALTTDCTSPHPRCTGRPHRFDPRYLTRKVLDEFVKAGGSAKCLTLRLDGEEAAAWKFADQLLTRSHEDSKAPSTEH